MFLHALIGTILLLPSICAQGAPKFRYIPSDDENTVNDESGQVVPANLMLNETDLVVGGIFSLTNNATGLPFDSGIQRALAFECAIKMSNEASGSAFTLFYNIQDDGDSVPFAVRAAVRLLNEGLFVIIGPSTSDEVVSASSAFGTQQIPNISPAATADVLSDVTRYPSFFRLVPPDSAQARAIVNAMVYFNWSLVTPIYTNDQYGQSGALAISTEANRNRVSFTCGRTITIGEVNGIQNTSDCLATSDSNVVLLYMPATDASNVIAALYPVSTNSRLTFVASDTWANVQDFRLFSRDRFPSSYLEGALGFAPNIGNQQPYIDCVTKLGPDGSDIPNFRQYWELVFRCRLDNGDLPVCTDNIEERDFAVISCSCTGNENLYNIQPDAKVAYVQDSVFLISETLKRIKDDCESFQELDICGKEELTPADFTAAMRSTEFDGLTGRVTFIGNDRYRTSGDSLIVGNFTAATNTTFDQNLLIFKTDGNSAIKSAAEEVVVDPSATSPENYPQSTKTYRIFKIFHNIRVTSLVIRDTDLLRFSALVLLGEVVLLSVYTFISPFPEPVVIQSKSDSLLQFVECKCPNSGIQTGLTIALIAYNVILVLAGCVIAYLTRNVDSAFNESQYIAVTMYIYLLAGIILIPLYYTAGDSRSSIDRQFVLRCLGITLSMYFSLIALFVPKIVAVEEDKKARREAERGRRGGDEGSTHHITDLSTTGGSTMGPYSRTGGRGTSSSQSGSELTSRRTATSSSSK